MIDAYKRSVLWSCRALQHIPGYRTYGRWMEEQYTKRFWTTVTWNMVGGMLFNVWLHRRITNWLNKPTKSYGTVQRFDDDVTMDTYTKVSKAMVVE